jgi:uncharacterized membrane protein
MALKIWQFIAMLCTAITTAAGLAHLFELPRKVALDREQYVLVQQLYRGWAWLGVAVLGALVSNLIVTVRRPRGAPGRHWSLVATVSIALSLAIFFLFTYPANRQTVNWTVLPDNWETLRRQWEYSHAVAAGFDLLALCALTLSLLAGRD